MRKAIPRAVAQHDEISREAYIGLWSLGLWALAALYLLATFSAR